MSLFRLYVLSSYFPSGGTVVHTSRRPCIRRMTCLPILPPSIYLEERFSKSGWGPPSSVYIRNTSLVEGNTGHDRPVVDRGNDRGPLGSNPHFRRLSKVLHPTPLSREPVSVPDGRKLKGSTYNILGISRLVFNNQFATIKVCTHLVCR